MSDLGKGYDSVGTYMTHARDDYSYVADGQRLWM